MSDKLPPVGRDRPFPWRCFQCKAKEVFPKATDYTATVKHDGRTYTIRIPDLEVPTCRKCGTQTFSVGDDERIVAALRAELGLLTPQTIHEERGRLGMTQQELAKQLGVAKETISRWETGSLIQSRAMDNLLRLFIASEEVRGLLRRGFGPDPPPPVNRIETPAPRKKFHLWQTFIDRLKGRCAKLAIGPSTLRGKGTRGVAAAARLGLATIDLATLAAEDRAAFRARLREITKSLKLNLPKSGRAWGRARKAVNIFLRDVVYNADLCNRYGLCNIREWLEVPLDSQVAEGLLSEPEGASLPRWPGVKHLRPEVSKMYQAVASAVAKRYGVSRVDLDVFYWRAAKDAFRGASPEDVPHP
jgi:putative zinc finger/helix-turn-helix YgiT family protein